VRIDSRASTALVWLSELLLRTAPGEQIPSRQELASEAGVGVGTLARAMDTLTEAGAVALNSVQRAGTSVERIDYPQLWRLAGRSILRGQLPMNLSVQMEAVEVALGQALTASDLDVALVYREGAARRMRAVENGLADFAVASTSALEGHDRSLRTACCFGPGSYYGDSQLYLLRRDDGAPVRRVGVDEHSPDHLAMVTASFPSAEIVVAPIRLIPLMIIDGRLDATIWFGGAALPVEYVNLLRTEVLEASIGGLLASQAVVVAPANGAVEHLFGQLDDGLLMTTYSAVLEAGLSVPAARDGVRSP
jgi:YhfZ C-terminal domain/Bacterial regulatory proteins, gntR family